MNALDAGWLIIGVIGALVLTAGLLDFAEHRWPAFARWLDRHMPERPWDKPY